MLDCAQVLSLIHIFKAFAITVILKFLIVLGLLFRTHDFYILTDPADRK